MCKYVILVTGITLYEAVEKSVVNLNSLGPEYNFYSGLEDNMTNRNMSCTVPLSENP
jgi:hypothetical protein